MIKLNNKNITYVALADSNNSIKAPKEIWYADSNNSVKLVYRRKDALIEDEDYEKYHWLKAEMPLNKLLMALPINSNNVDYYIKRLSLGNIIILITNGYKYFFWNNAYEIGSFGNGDVEHYRYSSDTQLFHIVTNSTNVLINNITYNSCGFPIQTVSFITEPSGNEGITLTSSIYVDSIERYIPCKLLKPVPKWLDANGIRRQVGECGMIDLVSGKFYGNVNSVGTFTVENYYERKEWLVADMPIGTSMMTLPVNSDTLYFRRIWKSFGNSSYFITNKYDYYTYFYQKKVSIYDSVGSAVLGNFGSEINVDEVIEIDSNSERMIMHNVEVPKYGFPITSIRLNNGSNGVDSVTHYTSVISVDSKERYIPCTLTMDLPASMDANNIARTKGTSGMWDLVSDKFYGNVASSGTFKAVNLAEGVDYEVHQWLKTGSGSPRIILQEGYNTDENAFIETTYKCQYQNPNVDMAIGFGTTGSNAGIRVFNASSSEVIIDVHRRTNGTHTAKRIWGRNGQIGVPRYLYVSLTEYRVDNISGSITLDEDFDENVGIGASFIYTNVYSNDVWYKETKLRANNITYDLIPCKLLRSIPSKYDANGIARQAGECGMYDTVNDVFYGNVASSGTFSVSDDS